MNYELIGENDHRNPVTQILRNREIKNSIQLLDTLEHKEVCHSYTSLDNMTEAVDLYGAHLTKSDSQDVVVKIIVDSDTDGYTSSAIMYNYTQKLFPKTDIRYHVHENDRGKVHGVFDEDIGDDIDLVIVPDAGSHSLHEIKKIKARGIDVLVLDHHNVDDEEVMQHCVMVNNQVDDYPNKELSGAGIAYKFCQALDDRFGVQYADNYLDLVAVGLIADSMMMTEPETRYYAKKGLTEISNPFLTALVEKQSYFLQDGVNMKSISWSIAPLINGTVRFGSQEERENMFEAMIEGNDKTLPYRKRGEIDTIDQPIAVAMARICGNAKGRQDTARDKAVESIEQQIEEYELDKHKILMVNATDDLGDELGSLSGLVAMQLADKYKKPTLVLRQNGAINGEPLYGGSGRNFDHSPIGSFQDFLLSLNKFDFVQGHDNAFGHQIIQGNISKALLKANQELENVDFTPSYRADFVVRSEQLSDKFFTDIDSLKDEWSKGFEEPYVVVENIVLTKADMQLLGRGKVKRTVKFISNGIEFIKFKSGQEDIDEVFDGRPRVSLTIVGRADINEWAGRRIPQIKIEDWNFEEAQEYEF